jgi:hypothetical protein
MDDDVLKTRLIQLFRDHCKSPVAALTERRKRLNFQGNCGRSQTAATEKRLLQRSLSELMMIMLALTQGRLLLPPSLCYGAASANPALDDLNPYWDLTAPLADSTPWASTLNKLNLS